MRKGAIEAGIKALKDTAGAQSVVKASEFSLSATDAGQLAQADTVVFDHLGVAVVKLERQKLTSLSSISDTSVPFLRIEPERIVHILNDWDGIARATQKPIEEMLRDSGQPIPSSAPSLSVEYLRGYRDAVTKLADTLIPTTATPKMKVSSFDESGATWGLQATNVVNSPYSGNGIKVAVLDTGLDLNHPDFEGRLITPNSFVAGQDAQDGHGHGTHCIGTACGSIGAAIPPPRYGIASNAEIFVGKVLNNQGTGSDGQILAGIEWAIANGCQIVSMSLGAPTQLGQPFSQVFEIAAQRALQNGTLIIAAAGNDSDRRSGIFNPVSHPANCPSIMAVAALDPNLQVANFSNRGLNPDGGQIDIAAPGVNVFSSWPMPTRYRTISGTSMATPHVAGIAALYAEATGFSDSALWSLLTQKAYRLEEPAVDVGAGLVQAFLTPTAVMGYSEARMQIPR
jgi:subtilisin family serine protease